MTVWLIAAGGFALYLVAHYFALVLRRWTNSENRQPFPLGTPMKRNPRQGLFNGFWTDLEGNRIRRIYREEYGPLYELVRKHKDIALHGRHTQAVALGIRPIAARGPWHG